jgi:hypothetical protein
MILFTLFMTGCRRFCQFFKIISSEASSSVSQINVYKIFKLELPRKMAKSGFSTFKHRYINTPMMEEKYQEKFNTITFVWIPHSLVGISGHNVTFFY